MNATSTASESPAASDRVLLTSRVFDVPRERLFRAWTEPEHLARWWGPRGFSNTFEQCEVRPGGVWRFVMHGPDGTNYKNESVFVEVAQPERIVLRHVSAPHFVITATFDEAGAGKTKLTWHMLFDKAEDCERVKSFAVDANEQNLERLAAEVATMA